MSPKCPSCSHVGSFAATQKSVRGMSDQAVFITCAMCGTVVGTESPLRMGWVAEALTKIADKLGLRLAA